MPFVTVSTSKTEEISVPGLKSLLRTLARAMGKREITMIWILEHCSAAEDPPEKVSVRIEAFDALEEEEERKEVESVVKDHFGQETLVELRLIQPHWVGALGEACKSLKRPDDGDKRLEHHQSLDESPACSSKMPFVKVATTLSRNQLPKDFMPKLNTFLASLLEKDPKLFKWTLDTDKTMGQGAAQDTGRSPFMLVEIESLKVFDSIDNCKKYVPPLFSFLQEETKLSEEEISTKFLPIYPQHVGAKGKTVLG